jgi:hypothetical protein
MMMGITDEYELVLKVQLEIHLHLSDMKYTCSCWFSLSFKRLQLAPLAFLRQPCFLKERFVCLFEKENIERAININIK